MQLYTSSLFSLIILLTVLLGGCKNNKKHQASEQEQSQQDTLVNQILESDTATAVIKVPIDIRAGQIPLEIANDIKVKAYFPFIDSIVLAYDSVVTYRLTEHLLVNANPWIIDTLKSFDYYSRTQDSIFVFDQREEVVLHKGDTLWLPNDSIAAQIAYLSNCTWIDVNIPEFKLRIMLNDSVLHTFTVRVGRDEIKFLKTAGRKVSLRTPIGDGEIVRIERNPWFVNPANGVAYKVTKRDDGVYTKIPQIPWLEPKINGIRYGALIHPTTNPETLGKPYSNGCVGTGEADAWVIYYHAPMGTPVRFRYNLQIVDEIGDTLLLKDIYKLQGKDSTVTQLYNKTKIKPIYRQPEL